MNDKKFLALSLQQSFEHPQLNGKYLNMFKQYSDANGFLYITNPKFKFLPPWTINSDFSKKCRHALKHDALHSAELMQALQTLKHYLSENVVMPEDFPDIDRLAHSLGLKSLDRSTAQKKLTVSHLKPMGFEQKLQNCSRQFQHLSEHLTNISQQDSTSFTIALLKDFSTEYNQALCRTGKINLFIRLNRHQIKQCLSENWTKIKNHKTPNIADLLNTRFRGQSIILAKKYFHHLHFLLLSLTDKMSFLSNYPETYLLIDTLIESPEKFRRDFQEFCRQCLAPNSDDIYSLLQSASALQNDYLFLCYLADILDTFETKFLDKIPVERQPELPTVDPQKELKEIKKIIATGQHISTQTKTARFISSFIRNFDKDISRINELWQRYTGPDTHFFTKLVDFDTNIIKKKKKS